MALIGPALGGGVNRLPPTLPRAVRTATSPVFEGPLIRFHIGLENPDDLIEDLAAALAGYGSDG